MAARDILSLDSFFKGLMSRLLAIPDIRHDRHIKNIEKIRRSIFSFMEYESWNDYRENIPSECLRCSVFG